MNFLGRILYVDLSTRDHWVEEISIEDWKKYLPGRGIGAKLLWDLTDEKTDPLEPENTLIFGVGGFSGTPYPCSGRVTATFKSPATGMYFKANGGGHWGAELKRAGFGVVVIKGKADKPVYINIEDDEVEIRDASHFWGRDVRETNNLLRKELKDPDIQTAAIGPAGENLVKIAALMFSTYNAAARGGGGAVMGSKNLKAISVRGSKEVTLANQEEFHQLAKEARDSIKGDSGYEGLSTFGTAGTVIPLNEAYSWPVRNFQKCHLPTAEKISGQKLVETGRLKRRLACNACIIGCHRYTEVSNEKYDAFGGGPELETIDSFGGGLEIEDFDTIIKANELCNILGMDTISVGGVIQWAYECFEKGLLDEKDTEGLELKWGNGDALVALVEKIAYREGLGDILAEGVKRAAEKIGQDSYKWALESKGLEHSGVDTRMAKAYALAFAVNPRGADHLHTETFAELGLSAEGRELVKKITKKDKFIPPTEIEGKAAIVRWHEDCFGASDALGVCAFTTTALYGISPSMMAEAWSAALGVKVTEEELMEAGRRMITMEKAYNVRCGADRSLDKLPWRLMNEDAEDRPGNRNMANTQELLDQMLDEYYELHNWDTKTSWPKKETYTKLGLDFVAKELGEKEKIPEGS